MCIIFFSLPPDFFDGGPKQTAADVKERAKAALLAGYSSSSEDDSENGDSKSSRKPDSSTPSTSKANTGLPAGEIIVRMIIKVFSDL